MSSFWRLASRTASAPLALAFVSPSRWTRCEEEAPSLRHVVPPKKEKSKEGMDPNAQGDYHDLFPMRQLWNPKLPYPLWHRNWDGREPPSSGDKEKDREFMRKVRKRGVTRHIILIRHGQYEESQKHDETRKLTPLGKVQADLTGRRLAEMLKGVDDDFGPCYIKSLRVSNMTRARETAEIIAAHLPGVPFIHPDPKLNEGRPCHHIPGLKATPKVIEITEENHARIEEAFRRYFYREPLLEADLNEESTNKQEHPRQQHEFDIIICHANVIRYFVCRALQLPPETWLRFCPFNCSLTYITIRATGSVSCRMLGDIGHLPYNATTFSKHLGYNW